MGYLQAQIPAESGFIPALLSRLRLPLPLLLRPLLLLALGLVANVAHSSCVILLHGLARSYSSMQILEQRLANNGFYPVNLGYPSTEHGIEVLADIAIKPALERCPAGAAVNFVTHSLGGILVRQYLSERHIPQLGRVVMLGPPNRGSEVVDRLGGWPGFHFINGDAGLQLGTNTLSLPNSLGPARFNVGIIAGNKTINWVLSALIPGPDDGKVSIGRTVLEGMNDHITMPVTHTFMMNNEQVIAQVMYYLKNGHFKRNDDRLKKPV